jgi:hypothetical protein
MTPEHYKTGEIECIDAMIETQGIEAVKSFCLCNAFKYFWRHRVKGGDDDIRKAKEYCEIYLRLTGGDEE